MSVHRSVRATLFVAVITALLFVVLAYSPATSKADAQSASAAPATKGDLTAKAAPTAKAVPCGFSFWRQTWRNCQNYRYIVIGAWQESATGHTGNYGKCVSPGTTNLLRVVPFGTVAITAHKYKRC